MRPVVMLAEQQLDGVLFVALAQQLTGPALKDVGVLLILMPVEHSDLRGAVRHLRAEQGEAHRVAAVGAAKRARETTLQIMQISNIKK